MKIYNVEFSIELQVEADSEDQAIEIAKARLIEAEAHSPVQFYLQDCSEEEEEE